MTETARRIEPSDSVTRRQILAALRALKRGEFDVRLPDDRVGIDAHLCEAFNQIAQILGQLRDDTVALQVDLGQQGQFRRRLPRSHYRGAWRHVVDSLNETVGALADHSEEMAGVVDRVRKGDLDCELDLDEGDNSRQGAFLKHARSINAMVAKLGDIGGEVTRVAQEVGMYGRLGAQAKVTGAAGAWRELTDSVNVMASNLASQVREIARVTTAVAQGDLSKTVSIDVHGEIRELKDTINTMVGQLSKFSSEVTRVAREVGNDGVLGGQAEVAGVSGVWRELTENVNSMANNLTLQVRNIAEVVNAIAAGDLSKKITVEVKGEILELKNTINTVVDQLGSFADEVTRVAREVGTEGMLGGQANVRDVSGIWKELTDNVNYMANNLTDQVRNIAEVVTAIAEGDLSRTITVDARGEILTLKNTINDTVDKLNSFSSEVTRVARLVGTEGTLGVQAEVKDVSGIWKELTDNVNSMASNLTNQVRNIAEVTTAVANGDLSKKITVEVKGEIQALKTTVNAMVDSLGSFGDEVTRMAREVGTEGILGGQAVVRDVSGVWKELTDNVNSMASNLTNQVRNIAEVARAVADGDLSKKITVEARGEIQDLTNIINEMVDQLNAFGAEVTRVARDVGVEGKLGGQASVEGVRGSWKELTDNVNLMASNLTNQVRDIAEVTTAVAQGDLTRKIVVDARGEILELKNTINTMVDQLSSFADEVTRLASDVGVEGKLGGQADVRGVSGTWRDLTDAVNSMATNLTDQVRNISQVASAIAQGDLQKKIVVDARGEILELKNTINTMVDQLSSFADQVTLVAREVGTAGKLGGQASVEGVRGTWKELTDNVNLMASNLTNQVRDIAWVATAIAGGDLGRKITVEVRGEMLDLKNTINTMVDQLSSFADEVTRVARDVGVEGKLGGQADVRGVEGIWKELTDNVNLMASNLTNQVRDIAGVTTAVANGDLSKKITVEVRGEILELKNTINTMVDQLGSFADEVTRVAREVGTEGILGGQAEVRGVSGTWRELTDNVNVMARNLTEQVRGIARVVTAVANGNLKQELKLDAKGEIETLVMTINSMIVTLSTFADQVTGVARDVGVEGKLGGQADVPGAAGIWRDLTNNVNELAGNLTRQVRAIGDVATAVTKGDLTQSINVDARGEVALLKDNLNKMIGTLAETTRVNKEQDWLKTNLTRLTRMLQGQRDLPTVAKQVLGELASVVNAQHGVFYMADSAGEDLRLKLYAAYAYQRRKGLANEFRLGEGLVGQAALEKQGIVVEDVPGDYIRVNSALGAAPPTNIAVVPILFEDEVKGVIELASFQGFTPIQLAFLDQLLESLGIVVTTIEATMRTDELLRQSQGLAHELQIQQDELQQTNEELEEKARQLTAQKSEVEQKNHEVELARQELEEKAAQLALTSRYKSQFLANMSHELRTPLNSLLVLSRQLADNVDGELGERGVEWARTIHQSGSDLLDLINEVLDLAKIESGTMRVRPSLFRVEDLRDYVERTFQQIAREKGLSFSVEIVPGASPTLRTDEMRLKQVLRNLLSNAFKFTEKGGVVLRILPVDVSRTSNGTRQPSVSRWLAFSVIDTGIGIESGEQRVIFEAFQQADGGTNRRYGGTGLGLSISREIATLLGGRLTVESTVEQGSTFTLYLPADLPRSRQVVNLPDSAQIASRSGMDSAEPMRADELDELDEAPAPLSDDRGYIKEGDQVLLVVEPQESRMAGWIKAAHERNLRVVIATTGRSALDLAAQVKPCAIALSLELDDTSGWLVLERFKRDLALRHVPVIVTGPEGGERWACLRGAVCLWPARDADESDPSALADKVVDQLLCEVDRRDRKALLLEPDERRRDEITALFPPGSIEAVDSVSSMLMRLEQSRVECLICGLPAGSGDLMELMAYLGRANGKAPLPVVLFPPTPPTPEESDALAARVRALPTTTVSTASCLLDRVSIYLHLDVSELPQGTQEELTQQSPDSTLEGKCVLVVDDDVRNIFALTSLLECHNIQVKHSENGSEALRMLGPSEGDVDLVLMDIMMPEMDGYEATQRIREDLELRDLPVIALTAKAMKGDREKCLQAGASDYITKPVDPDQLVTLLGVWLQP